MTTSKRLAHVKLLCAAAVIALGASTAGLAYAAGAFATAQPTSPTNYTVYAGGGHNGDDFTNISFTPDTLNIYVGDTVTFKNADSVEPHTVTFGDYNMLNNLSSRLTSVQPNKNGPPTIALLPKAVEPTTGTTYDGTGFANSGILSSAYGGVTHNSWTIKFTKAGTYFYYCLVHFPFMIGTIIVNSRPGTSSPYTVQMGYTGNGNYDFTTEAATFFPEDLTVHVGDVVEWQGSGHTVTFGTPAQIASLRTKFVLRSGKAGSYTYAVNPAIAFPSNSCGTSSPCKYSGGFLSSGLVGGLGGGGGGSYAVKFTKAGTYYYGCLVHKGMDGQITVLPAASSKKA
jgi:plastocyanin